MKLLLALPVVATLGLAACGTTLNTENIDHQAYAKFALGQVKAWNAAGIDPLKLEQEDVNYLVALCGTVVGAIDSGLLEMDNVTSDDVLAYCEAALVAALPAE